MPANWFEADAPCFDWRVSQLVANNCVSVCVSSKHLNDEGGIPKEENVTLAKGKYKGSLLNFQKFLNKFEC